MPMNVFQDFCHQRTQRQELMLFILFAILLSAKASTAADVFLCGDFVLGCGLPRWAVAFMPCGSVWGCGAVGRRTLRPMAVITAQYR
jgi:hypothetical protein